MNKLRVGVVMDSFHLPTNGGGYSYYQTLVNGINNFSFDSSIEIVNVCLYNSTIPKLDTKHETVFIKLPTVQQLKQQANKSRFLPSVSFFKKLAPLKSIYNQFKQKANRKAERLLVEKKIDLLYYPKQFGGFLNFPFIMNHWDVGHRSTYPFPEMAMNGHYEMREDFYVKILNKALFVMCESDAGAAELLATFKYMPDKVKVLPIFASGLIHLNVSKEEQLQLLNKHNLKKHGFFLYPAQFWPLKNHYNLLQAFKEIVGTYSYNSTKLVLCGSDMGNVQYIQDTIAALGLQGNVMITGFVSNEELYTFYSNAIAMVMPTFLGPTNMPLLEAAHLNCPVLCSNLKGHKEMMGNAALYFNPTKANEIAAAMQEILQCSNREAFVANAHQHVLQSPFILEKSLERLNDAFLEVMPIRRTWGVDSSIY